jgi:PilZ domain-containing protein
MLDMENAQAALLASYQAIPSPFKPRPPRQRICLSGKLVYGDPGLARQDVFTLDCTIRDISEGGAKIVLTDRELLPPDVFLIVVKQNIAYRAKVAWMNFPARGLAFLQAYVLKGALPGELRFLQLLSVELDARSGIDGRSLI